MFAFLLLLSIFISQSLSLSISSLQTMCCIMDKQSVNTFLVTGAKQIILFQIASVSSSRDIKL